jgi:hypothetical protein
MSAQSQYDGVIFLLGAGASYGHESMPGRDTPPLMNVFLRGAVINNVLDEVDFPQLAQILRL